MNELELFDKELERLHTLLLISIETENISLEEWCTDLIEDIHEKALHLKPIVIPNVPEAPKGFWS